MFPELVVVLLFFYGLFTTFWILVLTQQVKQTTCQANERVGKWRDIAEQRSAVYASGKNQNDSQS